MLQRRPPLPVPTPNGLFREILREVSGPCLAWAFSCMLFAAPNQRSLVQFLVAYFFFRNRSVGSKLLCGEESADF